MNNSDSIAIFWRKAWIALLIIVTVLLISSYPGLILVFFASILVGTIFNGITSWLMQRTRMKRGMALTLTLLTLIIVFAALMAMVGVPFFTEFGQLKESLSGSYEDLKGMMAQSGLWQSVERSLPPVEKMVGKIFMGNIVGVFSGLLGVFSSLLLVFFLAVYLAADPGLHVRGVLFLFPSSYQSQLHEALGATARALRFWMMGQLLSMCIVGVLTGIGVWAIGLPLALSLGIIAAFLTFVPVLGPIVAALPGMLLALSQSPMMAVYTALVYVMVQFVESYFLTPLIQKQTVELPPVLMIGAQALFGSLVGLLGIILAAPLAVALITLIQVLYVRDILGNDVTPLGKPKEG
jgi:predicted PurR-regulated permease PerM